ncbi:MAG TPA: nuclear transport factor 2 family protein [Acidimicrobiia bacterium]|nr:nuclear transport factor 2 family protein [Acidimicrobiia bacterium]
MPDATDAVRKLIYEYAARVDAGDFDGVAALFAHATYRGVVDETTTSVFRGTDEVRACFDGMVMRYDDGTPRTKHVTTNVTVDVDEAAGTARSRSYFSVLQQAPGGPLQVIVAGRYFDEFERVDGDWRFTDRLIHSDLVGDLSRHLKTNPLS